MYRLWWFSHSPFSIRYVAIVLNANVSPGALRKLTITTVTGVYFPLLFLKLKFTLLFFCVWSRSSPWWERRPEGLVDKGVQWEVPGAVKVHGQPVQQFHCGCEQRDSCKFLLWISSSSSLSSCLTVFGSLISIFDLCACLSLWCSCCFEYLVDCSRSLSPLIAGLLWSSLKTIVVTVCSVLRL